MKEPELIDRSESQPRPSESYRLQAVRQGSRCRDLRRELVRLPECDEILNDDLRRLGSVKSESAA